MHRLLSVDFACWLLNAERGELVVELDTSDACGKTRTGAAFRGTDTMSSAIMHVTPQQWSRMVHTNAELRRCWPQSAPHTSASAVIDRSVLPRCPHPASARRASLPVPRGACRVRTRQGWPLACAQPSRDAAAELAETSSRSIGGDGDINGQLAEVIFAHCSRHAQIRSANRLPFGSSSLRNTKASSAALIKHFGGTLHF